MAADNSVLPPGGGGDSVRDIDRLGGGVKTQVAQLDFGGDNTHPEQLVTMINGLPVQPATGAIFDTRSIIGGGSKGVTPSGFVTSTNLTADRQPVDVLLWSPLTLSFVDPATEATLGLIKAKTDNLNAGLNTLATAANQINGSQISQIASGTKGLSPAAFLTSTNLTVDRQPLDVILWSPLTGLAMAPALETGHLATIDAKTPALGPATSALASPVVLASDQVLPLPTNAAQEIGGNISTLTGIERARASLAMLSAQLQLIQPANGFFPVEIPAFLGGV